MNNLYELYKISLATNNILKKEQLELDFKKDMQKLICNVIRGEEEHCFSSDLDNYYKNKVGIKTKKRDYIMSTSYYFTINKTNLNKIQKHLEKLGDDDLSIKFC